MVSAVELILGGSKCMGKVMPRYCNVCGRLVTPREIERGDAIVYGMHCYCSKCKQEVMPIIEALKKRSQKEDTQTKQKKQKKARLQKATRTQVFFRRPETLKQRKPTFKRPPVKSEPVEAEVVEEPPVEAEIVEPEGALQNASNAELEPVDFSELKPVGNEVPLPPGPVKIGGKLIEVTPDGIKQQISPPRGPTVRTPHSRRPTTRRHIPHRPPPKKHAEELPPPPPPTKPSRISGGTLALILLILGIGGGLSYYFLIHRRHSSNSSKSGTAGAQQNEKEKQVAQKIEALKEQVRTLSNPSDWLSLKRQIRKLLIEVEGSQKARLERLLTEGDAWFSEQAQEAWNRVRAKLDDAVKQAAADPNFIPQLKKVLKLDTAFRGTAVWQQFMRQVSRAAKTEEIWQRFLQQRQKIKDLIRRKHYEEALAILDRLRADSDDAFTRALAFLESERQRIESIREQEERMAEQRRREAEREWARIKQDIARVLKERKFEVALQFVRAFLAAYKGTGPDKDAAQMLANIEAQKRAWELHTLIHNGQFRKGYWQTENLTVKKTPSGVLVSAHDRDGKLTLSADISNAEIFICLRRVKGKPAISLPKSASTPIIDMVTTLFPENRDVYLKLEIQDRRLIYRIGTDKESLIPYAPEHISGTDGIVFLLPAGSALLLKSVTVTRR